MPTGKDNSSLLRYVVREGGMETLKNEKIVTEREQ